MKTRFFIIVVAILVILTACYETNVNDQILNTAGVKVIVSTENGRAVSNDSKAVYASQEIDLPDSEYRPEVAGTAYISGITPTYFILDMDTVVLYEPKDKLDPTQGTKSEATILCYKSIGEWIIPDRINIISSKNIANTVISESKLNKKWDGLFVCVRPGGAEGTNGMWAGSLFCVKLPDGITRDKVKNALSSDLLPSNVEHRDDTNYAWIGFDDAVPFKNGFIANMCFQTGVEGVSFINPDHENGEWVYGPERGNGNQSGIVLPMEQIDFSNLKEAEFVFMFDTDECLDIYDAGNGDYWITLNKKNPLPFKIVTQEYDSSSVELNEVQEGEEGEVAAPIQCYEYDWTENDTNRHLIFTYTRPNANGVDTIRIYSTNEESFDLNSAKLEYEGSDYCYFVEANATNVKLDYYIMAVNSEGKTSQPVKFMYSVADFHPSV